MLVKKRGYQLIKCYIMTMKYACQKTWLPHVKLYMQEPKLNEALGNCFLL